MQEYGNARGLNNVQKFFRTCFKYSRASFSIDDIDIYHALNEWHSSHLAEDNGTHSDLNLRNLSSGRNH